MQSKALFKHFIAFLALGMNKSPSSRNSSDPFWGKMKKISPECVRTKEQIYRSACGTSSPLFILRMVVVMSSASVGSTNQKKQSRAWESVGCALRDRKVTHCCTFPLLVTYLSRIREAVEKNQKIRFNSSRSHANVCNYCTENALLHCHHQRNKNPEAAAGEKLLFPTFFLLFPEAEAHNWKAAPWTDAASAAVLPLYAASQGGSVCRD